MESATVDRIKHISNTEVIRRLLIKYMMDKGYNSPGSFDRQLYPTILQDLPYVIPVLANKIEIRPFAEDVNSVVGKARLGWNMFVLGNHRMYLGETFHNNLRELARQIHSGIILPPSSSSLSARKQTTPRRVVTFITRVLGEHDEGYVDLLPSSLPIRRPGEDFLAKQTLAGMPQFFTRSGYGV